MNRLFIYLVLGLTAAFFATVVDADQATIRVKCEKRSDRSKASVDGNNLGIGGNFKAQIMSGSNTETSPAQMADGDEAEFDFDSDPDDVAEGATAIAANFIQEGQVTGKILDADDGDATVIMDTVNCRVKD